MTKVWKADTREVAYTRSTLLNVKDFIGIKTLKGDSLLSKFPGAQIRIDSDFPPSDYFTAGPLFIVSGRLKAILETFSVDLESFPVDVSFQGRALEEKKFFFLNILDEADCLDRNSSEYVEKNGYVGDITRLVIDGSQLAGRDLFRLARAYQFVVLTSDRLAVAVESAGMTGLRFVDPW